MPHFHNIPDSKVHGANMGPTWVLSAPWTLLSGMAAMCYVNNVREDIRHAIKLEVDVIAKT